MIADADSSTVGVSLELDSASPTHNKPFSLVDSALEQESAPESNLRHLTKHRAGLHHHRRPPSRFRVDETRLATQVSGVKRLKSESKTRTSQAKEGSQGEKKGVEV